MSKRHFVDMDYNEDSCYSDEEDEAGGGQEQQHYEEAIAVRPRPGRPRKLSIVASEPNKIAAQMPLNAASGASTPSILAGLTPPTQRRRGRGPSKRPCLNRNALMARENRQKKKKYIECMEESLKLLQNENQRLKDTITKQQDTIEKLKQEVHYLHNVVSNAPEIEKLLRGINAHLGEETKCEPEDNGVQAAMLNGLCKLQEEAEALTWTTNGGLMNSTNTKNLSVPLPGSTIRLNPEVYKEDDRRRSYEQNNATPVARKTMPFILPKSENPSSVGSSMEDDERTIVQKSSPGSGSFCEYNTDGTSSMRLDNQLPTTPLSTLSNSIGQGELTLSETDFSQISPFNDDDDLFDFQSNDVPNPLQFETDAPDFINDDDIFFSTIEGTEINNGISNDQNEIKEMCDSLKHKPYYSDLPNTGVCLHINSKRVTLEYCSICHSKHSEKMMKNVLV